MKTTYRSAFAISAAALIGLVVTACGGDKSDDKPATAPAAAKGPERASSGKHMPGNTSGAVRKDTSANTYRFTAEAFHKKWSTSTSEALLSEFGIEFTVHITGTVVDIWPPSSNGITVVMKGSGGARVQSTFSDEGAALKTKSVAKGSTVAMRCTGVGMVDRNVVLGSCVLE